MSIHELFACWKKYNVADPVTDHYSEMKMKMVMSSEVGTLLASPDQDELEDSWNTLKYIEYGTL